MNLAEFFKLAKIIGFFKYRYNGVFANRPLTNLTIKDRAFFTDIGANGAEGVWDGTYWRIRTPVTLLSITTPIINTDAVTGATQLAQSVLPGSLFTPGNKIEIFQKWARVGAAASTHTINITLNGTNFVASSALASAGIFRGYTRILSRTMSSQLGDIGGAQTWGFASGATFTTTTFDQTTDMTLRVTSNWGTAGDGSTSAQLVEFDVVLVP